MHILIVLAIVLTAAFILSVGVDKYLCTNMSGVRINPRIFTREDILEIVNIQPIGSKAKAY